MTWKTGFYFLFYTSLCLMPTAAFAQEQPAANEAPQLSIEELIQAGGTIGFVILLLSIAMIALVVEHALTIRRKVLMPPGLAEAVHVHKLVQAGREPHL